MNGPAPIDGLSGGLELTVAGMRLRPLEDADADDLLAHFRDPRVVEFLDIEAMTSRDEALDTIGWACRLREEGRGLRWAIRDAGGGRFVGTCGFNTLVFERGRRGEVAYDLSPPWWGRGVMAAIMPVLIDFGLVRLGLHRLEAMVTPGNDRSCRLLERHGFAREGLLKGYGFWKGRYFDQIVYGLTRGDGAPTLEADQTAGRSPRF